MSGPVEGCNFRWLDSAMPKSRLAIVIGSQQETRFKEYYSVRETGGFPPLRPIPQQLKHQINTAVSLLVSSRSFQVPRTALQEQVSSSDASFLFPERVVNH
jgi:hypothetical protein